MNPRFPAWYQTAAIDPKDDFLRKRWAAIEKFGAAVTLPQALELVRAFYGMCPHDPSFASTLEVALQKQDAAFTLDGRTQEVALLAGAALTCLLEKKNSIADAAALAMVSVHCRGAGPSGVVPEIVKIHRDYLSSRTERNRPARPNTSGAAIDVEPALSKAGGSTDIPALMKDIMGALRPLVARVNDLTSAVADLREQNQQFREESNVLWWMMSGHSRDLHRPYSQLPAPSACVIAGKELAELVAAPVGAFAAPGFLDRVLRSAGNCLVDPVEFGALIVAVDRQWAQAWASAPLPHAAEVFCPTVTALREVLRVGSSWQDGDGKPCPIGPKTTLPGLEFACQAYEESLFLRLVGKGAGAP